MDRSRLYPWVVRVAWASLPFVAGPAFAAALDGREAAVRTVGSIGLWAAWAGVLVATLVLHPAGLTAARITAPAAVAAAAWATFEAGAAAPVAGPAGLAAASLAVVTAFLPETAIAFVNGPAYPNEKRFPLRLPAPLLLAGLPLSWASVVGGPCAAALLLASRRWVEGGVAVAVALPAALIGGRALYGLSRRWVVFVPAGLVIHDPMSLADPVLLRRQIVHDVAVAPPGDAGALDLTQRAVGLAVEVSLREETPFVLAGLGRNIGKTVSAQRIRFTPTLPGAVLNEAAQRLMPAPNTASPS